MPRLTDAVKDARKLQIIEAARACFDRRGFSATSMADIIKESGLSAGSIYSHFDGKADILRQTAEFIVGRAESILSDSPMAQGEILPPRDMARMISSELIDRQTVRMFLQLWAEAPGNAELGDVVRGNLNRVLALLRRALLPWASTESATVSDAEALAARTATAIMGLMHGYFVRITVDPAAEDEGIFEDLFSVLPGAEATTPAPSTSPVALIEP